MSHSEMANKLVTLTEQAAEVMRQYNPDFKTVSLTFSEHGVYITINGGLADVYTIYNSDDELVINPPAIRVKRVKG